MQVSKIVIALTVAAGFATAAFAEGTVAPASHQAAPVAKVATAPAAAEKAVDAPKAPEPAKVEAAKPATTKLKVRPLKKLKDAAL